MDITLENRNGQLVGIDSNGNEVPISLKDIDSESVTTDEAVINGGQVYVQDTRPSGIGAGDRWLAPGIIPAVGDPYLRYPLNEGAGTVIGDAVGDEDGTNQGATWESGTWVGGHALSGDGSSTFAELTTGKSLGSQLAGPLTIAATVQTSAATGVPLAVSDDPQTLYFSIGTLGAADGEVQLFVRDGSDVVASASSGSTVNDGSKHRVVVSYDGVTSPGSWTFAIDGETDSTTVHDSGAPSDFSDFVNTIALLAYNNAGAIERHFSGNVDDPTVALESWDESAILNDYDRQPWS